MDRERPWRLFALYTGTDDSTRSHFREKKNVGDFHLKASSLLCDDNDESSAAVDLAVLLVQRVRQVVASWLSYPFGQELLPPPLDLYLFSTIDDEAGNPAYQRYFDTADKIEQLVFALQEIDD